MPYAFISTDRLQPAAKAADAREHIKKSDSHLPSDLALFIFLCLLSSSPPLHTLCGIFRIVCFLRFEIEPYASVLKLF